MPFMFRGPALTGPALVARTVTTGPALTDPVLAEE